MAFVNKQGGAEQQSTRAAAGLPIDFDPNDDDLVKVHYDLSAWTFDQHAVLAEALAEVDIPHAWDGTELLVLEVDEEQTDALFERLEAEMGPFPVGLAEDDEAVEWGLDEWSTSDRQVLTDAIVEAEIPHRWESTTLLAAADAEESVDELLDAIESGELSSIDEDDTNSAPDGALSDIFLAANKLAKDPFDAKSRRTLIDLNEVIDKKHPPYALPPRVWGQAVIGVNKIVERISADAEGDKVDNSSDGDDHLEESSDVIGLAQELRSVVREYV